MSRGGTGSTEIIWITRNSLPKVPGPDPVHHHPCSQWVTWINDPLGQCKASLALILREFLGAHPAQAFSCTQSTGLHRITRGIHIPSSQDNIGIKISFPPGFLRHIQPALYPIMDHGFPGVDCMSHRFNPVEFKPVPDQILKQPRLGCFIPGIQTVLPHFCISRFRFFPSFDFSL